ncbi:MAG: hypothetical protein IPK82_19955 [Polyangiaceae bacterium]|nr:hypothetical protein [Polyangiaceae bacterium]
MTFLRYRSAACVMASVFAIAGCQNPAPMTPTRKPKGLVTPPAPPPRADAGPDMFAAAEMGDFENPEALHYFTRRRDGSLLVSVRAGHFWGRGAAVDGKPLADSAFDLGAAPTENAELVVAALKPAADGYLFAWVERSGDRTKVKTLALAKNGSPIGAAATLTETDDELTWIDVLPRDGGSLVVWERGAGMWIDVFGVALDAKGTAAAAPSPLLKQVLGWDDIPSGAGLAAVIPDPKVKPDSDDAGTVTAGQVVVVPIDASGAAKAPITVSASPSAQPDVIAAVIGGKTVLAWTDDREIDTAVWTASLDKSFAITTQPKRATPPTGEQALVAFVGTDPNGVPVDRGMIAWEDVLRAPPESRQIHLATVGADGSFGKERATMAFHADGVPPDLSCDNKGFGAVTLAPAWQGGAPPADAPVWPTFVRFGLDLSVQSAEPVRASAFGGEGVPYLVHELACTDGMCTTLGTGGENPVKAALVSLTSRKTEWYSPASRDPDDAPPRAASLSVVHNGDPVARVSATEIAAGQLVSWVTYSVDGDGSERNTKDGTASVWVAAVPAGAAPNSVKPVQLSKKAVSIGGISAAASTGDKKEIAIAWVAREKGESQVYVTKVDETGKKLAQKKISVIARPKNAKVPSEASDVAIAWSAEVDGWVVGWVDTRDGNAEVYTARIDRNLGKTVPDRRITDAPGDAAEVSLFARGKDVFAAWSDARQKPEEGKGDIFVAKLDIKTLTKAAAETRLATTPAHSRSPQLVPGPAGALWAAWVEDAGEADGGSARFAVLDAQGAASATTTLPGAVGHPVVSVAVACADTGCRGVVAKGAEGALLFNAFTLNPAAIPTQLRMLLTLPDAGSADVSPVFADRTGKTLFFGADGAGGTGRVRRVVLDW